MTVGRVAVTGAAGFVGGAVCRHLLVRGWRVVGIDNFDPFYPRWWKEARLARLGTWPRFSFVPLDVRRHRALTEVFAGTDVVVHLAARAGVRPSVVDPAPYRSLNVRGTAALLRATVDAGVARVVVVSSSSVYGTARPPFREDSYECRPASPYGWTKLAAERLAARTAARAGLRVAALRLFSVYGPEQRPDQALHRFARYLAAGQAVPRFGSGASARDYTFVEDVADGVARAVAWTGGGGGAFEVFNIGSGRVVALDDLIGWAAAALGVRARVAPAPPHPGDAAITLADLSKAGAVLGYRPTTTIDDGIAAFTRWFEVVYGRESRAAS